MKKGKGKEHTNAVGSSSEISSGSSGGSKEVVEEDSEQMGLERVKNDENIRVPANLPIFRGHGSKSIDDPQEFLDQFQRICVAYDVPLSRYGKILPLCLDSTQNKWYDRWIEHNEGYDKVQWSQIRAEFIKHFQHLNQAIHLQAEIRKLRMANEGVQWYTDNFLRLAEKLGWSTKDQTTIFQYKLGLSKWMLNQLSIAEAMMESDNSNGPSISVEILGNMAQRIESNHLLQSDTEIINRDKNIRCYQCGGYGHRAGNCGQVGSKQLTHVGGPIKESRRQGEHPEWRRNIVCYKCGGNGHFANTCMFSKEMTDEKVALKPKSSLKSVVEPERA